jgi:hypothetical protein
MERLAACICICATAAWIAHTSIAAVERALVVRELSRCVTEIAKEGIALLHTAEYNEMELARQQRRSRGAH